MPTWIAALRSFRVLRVLTIQGGSVMQRLLTVMAKSISDLSALTMLLLLVLFVCAVCGLNMFHGVYTTENFPGGVPRWNFLDFGHSFMMVFRILCGEWIEPLRDTIVGTDYWGVSVLHLFCVE